MAAFGAALTSPMAWAIPKVLLVGIDGVRPDQITLATSPNYDALVATGAYRDDALTVSFPTSSGPGWSDILTGVGNAKHGVTGNSFSPPLHFDTYPDVLTRLEQQQPALETVAVTDWLPFNTMISNQIDNRITLDGDTIGYGPGDAQVTQQAVQILANDDPDAIFVYYGNTDVLGHSYGTLAPQTIAGVETVDGYMAELIVAIQNRPTISNEEWLVLLATDHGRTDGGGHGGSSADEMDVFFLLSRLDGTPISIEFQPSNVDFAPTILHHMLGAVDASWDLDGRPVNQPILQATAPGPADGVVNVPLGTVLSWTPGANMLGNEVFFGTTSNPGAAEFRGAQTGTVFDPGPLDLNVTYYWRIDTVTAGGTIEGEVWSFTADSGVAAVGLWNFDEGEGTTTADALGGGLDGAFFNGLDATNWINTEILGKGLSLSSADGWVSFGNDIRFMPNSALTVSAWVKPALFTDYGGITGIAYDTGATESGYYLHTRSNGRFGWAVTTQNNAMLYVASPAGLFQSGVWYHLAGVYDGSVVRLYVDGAEVASAPASGLITYDPIPFNGFMVGTFADDNEDIRFNGEITQAALWRRGLSEQEISDLVDSVGPSQCLSSFALLPNSPAGTVTLSWDPEGAPTAAQIEILRDGTVIATVPIDTASYLDAPPGISVPGHVEFNYTIRMVTPDPNNCPSRSQSVQIYNGTLRDDLVLYLPFDGDSEDHSANGLSTALSGAPDLTTGQIGEAYEFDDTALPHQYVNAHNPAELQFGTSVDFSVSLWMKSTSLFDDNRGNGGTNYDPAIISNKDWNSGLNAGWVIAGNASNAGFNGMGNLEWNIGDGSNRVDFDATNVPVNDGVWHHIVVTHDRDGDAEFFLDGRKVGSATISHLGNIDSGLPTCVATDGTLGTVWESRFPGAIDDVAIWRRLLTTEEMTSLYTRGLRGESAVGGINHSLVITGIDRSPLDPSMLRLTWPGTPGKVYDILINPDLSLAVSDWAGLEGSQDIPADLSGTNTLDIAFPFPGRGFVALREKNAPPLFFDDLESGVGDWTTEVNDDNGNTRWEFGTPVGSTGPLAGADDSANAWCTNLGDYGADSDISLRSPAIDLAGVSGAELSFAVFRDGDGFGDTAVVRFLRAADQMQLGADTHLDMSVLNTDYATITIPVVAEALAETILVEWNFVSDSSADFFSGLSIDNIGVSVTE